MLPDMTSRMSRARQLLAARDELVGGQQHAGRAEAALRGVARDELALQFGKLAAVGHAFDGVDGLAGNLRRQRQAAARRAAVDQHRAGAANAVLAAEMRAGQLQLLPQEIRQMLARLDAPLQRLAVQGRFDLDLFVADQIELAHAAALSDKPLRTRRVSTVAMCSRVSPRSPGVSSGARSCRIACSNADVSGSGARRPVTAAETVVATLGTIGAAEINQPRLADALALHGGDCGQSRQREIAMAARQFGKSDRRSRRRRRKS